MNKLKVGDKGYLVDLCKGQKALVIGLCNDNKSIKRRLLDMGITTGVEVMIKKISPMGDPVDIYLRGYELCIRKKDMKGIIVKVIE